MKNEQNKTILYTQSDADALTKSEQTESWRLETDRMKVDLILKNAGGAKSLLDIGCAWGQILRQLVGKIPVLAGVDESGDRLGQLRDNDLGINTHQCSMSELDLESGSFDIVLASHVMHELKLFGSAKELKQALSEIRRVLTPNGRYFLIDHADPGEGAVTIRLKEKELDLLRQFARKFKYRKVQADIKGSLATLSLRDCHDFITKIWAMGGGAEELEMKETHTAMKKDELKKDLAGAGFGLKEWIPFNSITGLMKYYSIELVEGKPWDRQFMMIAGKI